MNQKQAVVSKTALLVLSCTIQGGTARQPAGQPSGSMFPPHLSEVPGEEVHDKGALVVPLGQHLTVPHHHQTGTFINTV